MAGALGCSENPWAGYPRAGVIQGCARPKVRTELVSKSWDLICIYLFYLLTFGSQELPTTNNIYTMDHPLAVGGSGKVWAIVCKNLDVLHKKHIGFVR